MYNELIAFQNKESSQNSDQFLLEESGKMFAFTIIAHNIVSFDALTYGAEISPTVDISWFVSKAHVANFYYTKHRDYNETLRICNEMLHTYE